MVRGQPRSLRRRDGESLRALRGAVGVAEPPSNWKPYLGRKVSIRYRLRDEPGFSESEAIGVVQSVEQLPGERGSLKIMTRAGRVIEVVTEDVLAAKVWPV